MAQSNSHAIRVLHCPDLVGGHPFGVAKAERAIGLSSQCVALRPHPFGYSADRFLSSGGEFATQIARWRLLAISLQGYDIIHFNIGQSTMPQRVAKNGRSKNVHAWWIKPLYNVFASLLELNDLPILKWMGKGIVMTYQGDDARQGDFLRAHYTISPADEADYYTPESDRLKREKICVVDRYADAIFAVNPDLLQVLPKRAQFLPYAHLDISSIAPVPFVNRSTPIVAHAPSHRGVKGTRFVLDAVRRLTNEGLKFEFRLIEGLSHAEAMKLYQDTDILIDQLLVGWYGGLAVEFMALGKPVVAYIREEDLGFIPQAMRQELPVVSATPQTIYQVLRDLLTVRRHHLRELGERSRRYAESWHEPIRVAATLKDTYESVVRGKRNGKLSHPTPSA